MKIAIEGMDGVGKTTIAKELAKRNNFKYIGDAIHGVRIDIWTHFMRGCIIELCTPV